MQPQETKFSFIYHELTQRIFGRPDPTWPLSAVVKDALRAVSCQPLYD